MTVHFLTEKLTNLTGGSIYDTTFWKKMQRFFSDSIRLIDSAALLSPECDGKRNFIYFAGVYNKNATLFLDCDLFILNSRLYTRFYKFPWRKKQFSRCKMIVIHHHFNYMSHRGLIRMIHRLLEFRLLRMADVIVTPNLYMMDLFEKFRLKGNAVLIEAYINNKIHPVLNKKDQILFVGTVQPRKGLIYGIKAFYKFWMTHRNYDYIIVGTIYENSIYYERIKRLVKKLGISEHVIFRGRVCEEEKKRLYEESKILLFPSQNEGYGLAIIEAMSYGMPVIAFDVSAMPYTVNERNGALVQNRDIQQMAKQLCRITDDTTLYNELQQGAYETVQTLPDEEEIDAEYEAFYKKIVSEKYIDKCEGQEGEL